MHSTELQPCYDDVVLLTLNYMLELISFLLGTTMIGYQPLGDKPNFFRYVCANPAATKEDIDFLLNEIRRLGESEDTKWDIEDAPPNKYI